MSDKRCPQCGTVNAESALKCDCGYDFTSGQPKESTAVGKQFGIRAGSYIIDCIVLFVLNFVIGFIVGFIISLLLTVSGHEFIFDQQAMRIPNIIGGLILSFIYFAIFEWLYGATLGKLILGMRVVEENGDPCSFGSAVIRGLLRYIDGLFVGIPAYASMKHPLYQRIGDKAAKTIVVGSDDPVIRQSRVWWWFLIAAVIYIALNILIVALTTSFAVRM